MTIIVWLARRHRHPNRATDKNWLSGSLRSDGLPVTTTPRLAGL